jgi:hypothetical protein
MTGLWTVSYSGVKRANDVIKYIGWAKMISHPKTKKYMRLKLVFYVLIITLLGKFWGNIPYYTENLEFPYIKEQSAADDVYNNICY